MRPIALIFATIFFAVGAGLAWLIASSTISWVETSQKAELEQAFYAGGIGWAEAEADGFVVTLMGEADSVADQERAAKIARLIFGDSLVDDTTVSEVSALEEQQLPPFVEILKNGDDFSFLGRMPMGETTQVFARYVESLGESATVSNVTEAIENAPENWLPAFEFALRLAPLTEQSIVNIHPGAVELEAVAMSANWQQGFEEMAENLRPEGVSLTVNISAPRPVISPYTFILDVSAPDAARCAAQDELEAKKIATKVERLIGLSIKCDVGLGAPSTHWREAVNVGLDALAGLGGGRLEIVDADVTLSAPEGVSEQDFQIISQILRFGLPDGFALEAIAIETPPRRAEVETQPAEFTATLGSEGNAVIEGAVKDTLTREVVMRYSEAKFGYGRVEDRMWLDTSLPDGWQVRIFKLIEALALLNEGSATMTPEGLDIAGDAGFENPDQELGKLLAGGYRLDETTLSISYTEPVGGEGGRGLDPRLCVSRITKILSESSIVFAPSSAVISDPSIPTIEAIAALLTTCREARIEIGGHTDSQGREEMNRALSQGRADAVLDALLAQNLLLGTITAKGYGEAEPISDNGSDEGRAANRRIEFKLLRDVPEETPEAAPEVPVGAGQVENFKHPAMRAPVTEEETNE
ncbi:MAG: OmpA family protein [Rhodobacteraceae bacterium]|nr:OmpA family protein [Paracoccaceae bacterium]